MAITTRWFTPSLACLVLVMGVAQAQPGPDRSPAEMLKRADSDGDGLVSRDEFVKARTAELEAMFDRMDANGDGKIDQQELGQVAERMRAMAGSGREGPSRRPEGERPMRREGEGPQRPTGGGPGEQAFDRFDADGDGKLTREEFAAGMAKMREIMQRNGGRPGAPGNTDRGGRSPEEGFRKPPEQN